MLRASERVRQVVPVQPDQRTPLTTGSTAGRKKLLRSVIVFMVALVVVGIVRFPYDSFSDDIVRALKQEAKRNRIVLNIENLSTHFPGKITTETLSGYVAAKEIFPIPFFFSDLTARVQLLPFLWLSLQINGEFKAYKGQIGGEVTQSLISDSSSILLHGTNLQLEEHPTLELYGLQGALEFQVTGEITRAADAPPTLSESELALKITNGRIVGKHTIAGIFPLPNAKDINIAIAVTGKGNRAMLESFKFASSLGSANGSGSLELNEQGIIDRANFNFEIGLTSKGEAELGNYLALAAGEPLDSGIQNWKISISKPAGKAPSTVVSPRK